MDRLTVKIILALIVAGFVVLALIFGPAACNNYFAQKKRAEVAKGQAGAAVDSGAEAMNTASNTEAAKDRIEQNSQEAINEVRKAQPGHSNDAAIRAACRVRHDSVDERCARLRKIGP